MDRKRGNSLFYWRMFSFALIILMILALLIIPLFLSGKFNFFKVLLKDVGVFLSPESNESFGIGILNASEMNATESKASFAERPMIGKPVQWIKKVKVEGEAESILLPKEAENIVIKKTMDLKGVGEVGSKGESKETTANESIANETILNERKGDETILNESEGAIINNSEENADNITEVNNTGENITDENNSTADIFGVDFGLTGEVISGRAGEEIVKSEVVEKENSKEVIVDGFAEYEIEYSTPAPSIVEEAEGEYRKKVVVSGPELGYENILTFTSIPEVLPVGRESSIKVYWVEQGTYEPFTAYDSNGNGMLDYVEWNTPHLSEQTFEIILITKAEHLDENRIFVEDIYEEVKERDNVWKEIPAGDYLRVTFERNLTSEKDITIYARSSSGAGIDIYEKDKGEIIASFDNVGEDKEYKVYLSNLIGEQNTFDLFVKGGSVEFDYVVDPPISACGILNAENTIYTLTQDVSSSATCFNITADNIVLDCQRHIIKFALSSKGYGVFVDRANYSIIRNCNVSSLNGTGIYVYRSLNSTLINNSVNISGSNVAGVLITSSNKTFLFDNNITFNGTDTNGLSLTDSNYTFINNLGLYSPSIGGTNIRGINFGNSFYNIINNVSIKMLEDDTIYGIYGIRLDRMSDTSFSDIDISLSDGSGQAIFLAYSGNNITFRRMNLHTGTRGGIWLYNTPGNPGNINFSVFDSIIDSTNVGFRIDFRMTDGEWNFTNVTKEDGVSSVRKAWEVGANGVFNNHLYVNAYANYTDGTIAPNANISAQNINNALKFSVLTGGNGRIARQTLLEYKQTSDINKIFYSNYTFNATNPFGFQNITQSWNMSMNRDLTFTFGISCGILDKENMTYKLISNVSSSGTCFTITANNVTLDCNGYEINYSYGGILGYGVYSNRANFTKIWNCTIIEGVPTTNYKHGIWFYRSSNGSIINTSVKTKGSYSYGILLEYLSNSNTIDNARIHTTGTFASGIYTYGALRTIAKNNFVETYNDHAYALDLVTTNSSLIENNTFISYYNDWVSGIHTDEIWNNVFNNNNLTCYGGSYCFFNVKNYNSIISNTTIYAPGGYGFKVENSNNNMSVYQLRSSASYPLWIIQGNNNLSIQDSVLTGGNILIQASADGGEWNFTNVSYIGRTWNLGASGTWNVHWYVNAYANYTDETPAADANITTWNNASIEIFSQLTDSSGLMPRQVVLKFKENSTGAAPVKFYYSNYTFNATSPLMGVEELSLSRNISNNTYLVFTFDKGTNVLINFTEPTPPNGSVRETLYVPINVSIIERNLTNAIFNWNKTNYTIYNDSLVLLMNFENLSSLGENDSFVRDVSIFNNNGIVKGGAAWNSTDGKYGGAYEFDGINDYIEINKSLSLNAQKEFSAGAWVISKGGNNVIVGKTRGSIQSIMDWRLKTDVFTIYGGASFIELGYSLPLNEWHYVFGTYNLTNIRIYVDGDLKNSISPSIAKNNLDIPVTIGARNDTNIFVEFFDGMIDEVQIWNRSLKEKEIRQLYFTSLHRHDSENWELFMNQGLNSTNGLAFENYTYFAAAEDVFGNKNQTEMRTLFSDLRIVDIDDLKYRTINPGGKKDIKFSVYIVGPGQASISKVNATFSRGATGGDILRGEGLLCSYADKIGSLLNYSCSSDIWYFDEPGEWNVSASVTAVLPSILTDKYTEGFVLMSEASITHQGSLSWETLLPTDVNREVSFLLNNTGNVAFSSISLMANSLTRQPSGAENIPAANFRVHDVVGQSCGSGTWMSAGNSLLIPDVNLAVGNNSINTRNVGSGQEELFDCLTQIPEGLPPAEYTAKDANSWQLTAT